MEKQDEKPLKVGDTVKLSPYAIMCFVSARIEERDPRHNTGEYFDSPFGFLFNAKKEDYEFENELKGIWGIISKDNLSDSGFEVDWKNDTVGLQSGVWHKGDLEKINNK